MTREQLLVLGLGPSAITHRCRNGRLHPSHQGVYGVGKPPVTPLERAAAAVLACGPGAALSHTSALTLWGFAKRWETPLHVIPVHHRSRPEIITHEITGLTRADFRTHLGIRVTSPARTVLDCAPDLPTRRLTRIVNDGRLSGKLKRAALDDVRRRFPSHPGSRPLNAVLDEHPGAPTRSEFEDAFLAFCERFGLPRPQVNTHVGGREVDALFEDEHLIVELDGWAYHQDHTAFEGDRLRDADALELGVATLRITWDRMVRTPNREAARLLEILYQRQAEAEALRPQT